MSTCLHTYNRWCPKPNQEIGIKTLDAGRYTRTRFPMALDVLHERYRRTERPRIELAGPRPVKCRETDQTPWCNFPPPVLIP